MKKLIIGSKVNSVTKRAAVSKACKKANEVAKKLGSSKRFGLTIIGQMNLIEVRRTKTSYVKQANTILISSTIEA